MQIGELAKATATKVTTIRFYEGIGLLGRPARTTSGRRTYGASDTDRLNFIRNGRRLGFSIDDCRQLMALYRDRGRASQDVRAIASAHVAAIEEKVRELQSMRMTLNKLIHACHGDERPNCPILEEMAGEAETVG